MNGFLRHGVQAVCLSVMVAANGLTVGAVRPGASAAAPVGAPAPAEIKVSPVVADGRVTASFAAPDAFTDDSQEVVKSGVPLTFTFVVELKRPSSFWWDRTLGGATVAAKVKFDNLTAMFQVTKEQDGRVTWSKSTAKEEEMRGWVTAFDAVPIQASEALEPNADYYVRVRLESHPHMRFSVWPWGRDDASGRADFTFIR